MKERALKTDHVLVFHHRIDLVNLMEHFMNHDQVKPLEECVQILGFDGVLYKVVVAKLYPEFPISVAGEDGPVLPLLWRTRLGAAYRVKDNKLVSVAAPLDGLHSRISDDKCAALGEYLATIIPSFRVFDGKFGFELGKRLSSTE